MSAPVGNQFWKARSSHGRKPIFADPEQLWECCVEYFEWVEANPLQEEKVFHAQGEITRTNVAKMRPMTLSGLCLFLDIDQSTWENYRIQEDFFRVTKQVEQIIYNQKFSGAVADLMNANIIARDLGLKDESKHEHTGANGGPLHVISSNLDQEEAAKLYSEMVKN